MCDLDDISTVTLDELVYLLCRFILEAHKKEGVKFPPQTLCYIIVTIQMYLEHCGFTWKLINGPEFTKLKWCLDNQMKENASAGLGSDAKSAKQLEVSGIDKLWINGLLGEDMPLKLVETVLFLMGVNRALHAFKEHKMLCRPKCNITVSIDNAGWC